MSRYIDAEDVKLLLWGYTNGDVDLLKKIDQIESKDVAPVIHAHWIADVDNPFGDLCMCSNCKEKIFDMDADRISFCPYCGANMKDQKPDPLVGYLYKGADGIARCSCCNKPLRYLVRPFEEMKMCPYCKAKLEPREEE